jgi:hypothetical protein
MPIQAHTMQVTSVTAAGSTRLRSSAHQCPHLAVRSRSNILASHEPAAVCVVPRNSVLRVSPTDVQPLHDCSLLACMQRELTTIP